jgi:rhamnogalacturonyl hydrolase YesR
MHKLIVAASTVLLLTGCATLNNRSKKNVERGRETLDSIYTHYSVEGTSLLREIHPFAEEYKATYLASEEQANRPNPYAYLWPFSGTFSAVNALLEATNDKNYQQLLDTKVLPGLEEYLDTKRTPSAYASYIHTAPPSDRFYDDNIWLGIDFSDTYTMTGEQKYLDKAKLIWQFIESGIDEQLGGGIYWCEQKKESKNTCSNAPGSVLALKLFEATKDSNYFHQGKALYHWTKTHLQDPSDNLYYDNVGLNGRIGKAKFAYNSGQMLQSAVLLYKLTKEKSYLTEAQNIAKSGYNQFFQEFTPAEGSSFMLLKRGNIWFTAVMLRGYIELYKVDKNKSYLDSFQESLDYAWTHMREETGLFNQDWSGESKESFKSVLTQAAMVEMYARMAAARK